MADNKKPSVPKLSKLNTSYECIASSFTAFNAHPHFAYSVPSHAVSRICPHVLRYPQSSHQTTHPVTDGRLNQQLDDIKAQMVIIDTNTKSLIAEMKHEQPLHTDQKEATLGIDTIAIKSTVKKMKMQAKMMKKYRKRVQQQEKVLAEHNEALGQQQILFKQLQDVVEQQNVVIQEHKETLHEQSDALQAAIDELRSQRDAFDHSRAALQAQWRERIQSVPNSLQSDKLLKQMDQLFQNHQEKMESMMLCVLAAQCRHQRRDILMQVDHLFSRLPAAMQRSNTSNLRQEDMFYDATQQLASEPPQATPDSEQ